MAIDWTPIFKKHKGKWVALEKDEETVITAGKFPGEVLNEAAKKGFQKPILLKVPTEAVPYIGLNEVQV